MYCCDIVFFLLILTLLIFLISEIIIDQKNILHNVSCCNNSNISYCYIGNNMLINCKNNTFSNIDIKIE